jgi:hypothetical protein
MRTPAAGYARGRRGGEEPTPMRFSARSLLAWFRVAVVGSDPLGRDAATWMPGRPPVQALVDVPTVAERSTGLAVPGGGMVGADETPAVHRAQRRR